MRESSREPRSPIAGTVRQLSVRTTGAVLKPADPVLVVVPANSVLVVEAKVLNKEVGFVAVGQRVTVKLEAFPFTWARRRRGPAGRAVAWAG